jgi:hypothetical protein
VGVWSLGSEAAVKDKAQKVFGNFHNNLLFLFPDEKPDRDLRRIWFNFPEFSVNNTFYVSGNPVVPLKEQESCFLQTTEFKGEKHDRVVPALENYLGFFLFKQAERKISSVPQLALKIGWKHYFSQYIGPENTDDMSFSQRFK